MKRAVEAILWFNFVLVSAFVVNDVLKDERITSNSHVQGFYRKFRRRFNKLRRRVFRNFSFS